MSVCIEHPYQRLHDTKVAQKKGSITMGFDDVGGSLSGSILVLYVRMLEEEKLFDAQWYHFIKRGVFQGNAALEVIVPCYTVCVLVQSFRFKALLVQTKSLMEKLLCPPLLQSCRHRSRIE
jgi:hypothetical protein